MDVFFNVDKPAGPTSHDVVARLRRAARVRRIGHAGTLDPMATGVLVVATGRATRLIEYLADAGKAYLAEVTFGIETDTYDAEGRPVDERDASHLTFEAIAAALDQFRGVIQQRPPAYSAISVGGRRLYDLARRGEPVTVPERTVEITAIELRHWNPPVASLQVECSKGTYIRSLAHDLGQVTGTGAHLSALMRTRVGRFTLQDAVPLSALVAHLAGDTWPEVAIAPHDAVDHLPAITLADYEARRLAHGMPVKAAAAGETGTLARALSADGSLLAIVRLYRDAAGPFVRPEKVFAAAQ